MPASEFDLPVPNPRTIDIGSPLDIDSVATLAVLNDPDLKAARLNAGVARAQLFEAGLLPDPRLSAGLSRSAEHGGYGIGIAQELLALATRGTSRGSGRAHLRRVNLEILWQEWQAAERARELFIQIVADQRLEPLLLRQRNLLEQRYRADETAVRQSAITAAVAAADFSALAAAESQLRQVELDLNSGRHALDELLGVRPDVIVALQPADADPGLISKAEFVSAAANIQRRRADLLALAAGYRSEEEQVRRAVLEQFPSIGIGVEQGRSAEEGVRTVGFTVDVSLPLFNRNRGQIAIGRATRAVLWQEYNARLDQAANEAHQLWQATGIMVGQLATAKSRLPELERAAKATAASYRRGDVGLDAYIAFEANLVSAQTDVIRLRAALARSQSALRVLLAMPFGGKG